ncbi:DUF1223 domain-containing protein [Gymnodinialimonas sp. 2305UL16-5]|uniref:DUF1223 domain-containing protein n=1 Tax=Gymnodinialimonas mytili TaxID=3126503 RepID=UPI0030AA8CC1
MASVRGLNYLSTQTIPEPRLTDLRFMLHRFALCAAFGAAVTASSAAADQPVVIELFTSQGCAACPPADELLGQLSERSDVIPLALHVDYWDYIGWSDTFAQPAFTARQHGYGHAAGSSVVYTPQMVVGGVDHVVGYRPMEVADLIAAHTAQPDPVEVSAEPQGGGWRVTALWRGDGTAPQMVVQLVAYSPAEEVDITRGENAGLTTMYYNIVTSWQVVAEWGGDAPWQAQVMPAAEAPHVVIVQSRDYGAILGAERLE